MKNILFFAITFLSLNAFAQIRNIKVPEVKNTGTQKISEPDTIIRVVYIDKNVSEKKPAFYLNGQFVCGTLVKTLNPDIIESINVEKQEIEIEGIKYYGQILINTRSTYKPKLISLSDLKLKYTDLKSTSTIFMIDNEIINEDYHKSLVDENYILKISIEKIENKGERLNFNLIIILTRTEENLKKSREIIIRGI
jgi:hypothetical protein